MGRRGPRPLPEAILTGHGSWRANLCRDSPEPPPGRPSCPSWLDKDAKRAWRQLAAHLDISGLLTALDRNALTRYCRMWSRWRKAEEFLQKYGETYPLKDASGAVRCFVPWPQVAIASGLNQALTRLEQEFGLTPSARTRIAVDPKAKKRAAPRQPGQLSLDEFLARTADPELRNPHATRQRKRSARRRPRGVTGKARTDLSVPDHDPDASLQLRHDDQ